jgi:signal transduction histidine kinase
MAISTLSLPSQATSTPDPIFSSIHTANLWFTALRASANSLLTILNDILDFSKIEAGKMEIERRPFDLRATVTETAALFQQQFANKGLELTVKVASGLPARALGDSGRVQQVMRNLLGDAMKFTEQGRVRVGGAGEPRRKIGVSLFRGRHRQLESRRRK